MGMDQKRIVWQCVEAGLIAGDKLFFDSSMIDADASNNSVINRQNFKGNFDKQIVQFEDRLEDKVQSDEGDVNSRYISTTDPDTWVTRHGKGKPKLRYKTHRGVDAKHEVITATKITTGSTDDAHLLKGTGRQRGIFPKEEFIYNPHEDIFTCPAGKVLRRRHYHKRRKHYEYKAAKGSCVACKLKAKCTNAKDVRTLKRHIRQDDLDEMLDLADTEEAGKDIKYPQHLSGRSFARSVRYGYKRARCRRLWRMQIQDYLISALQNILIIVKNSSEPLMEIAVKGLNELSISYYIGNCSL